MDVLVTKATLVKCLIPGVAGGQRAQLFNFSEQNRLRGARVSAIELITPSEAGVTDTGQSVAAYSQLRNAYLTININGKEDIDTMPVLLFHYEDNSGMAPESVFPSRREIFKFKEAVAMDFSKSVIKYGTPPNNTADFYIMFMVYYTGGDY